MVWLSIRNIFIIFNKLLLHGANWTFIMWGLIHAMLYIPLFLRGKIGTPHPLYEGSLFPSIKELYQMGVHFFHYDCLGIFRAGVCLMLLDIYQEY